MPCPKESLQVTKDTRLIASLFKNSGRIDRPSSKSSMRKLYPAFASEASAVVLPEPLSPTNISLVYSADLCVFMFAIFSPVK